MDSLQAAVAREVHRERLAVAERHRLVKQARAARKARERQAVRLLPRQRHVAVWER